MMAEGNAGVYDFDAIRKALSDRGYRPVWHTEATDHAEAGMCPATGPCKIPCEGGTANCAPSNCRLKVGHG